MSKAMKLLTWVLALFCVVIVLALAALYLFADPNKLKPVIADEVLKRTGYNLVFDGDLSWSLYPQVGVKAQHLTLTEPNQKRPFIDLKRVNIALSPLQLLFGEHKLSGEVHVADVVLMNVHMTSMLVGLNYQDGAINFQPVQATLYGGSMNGIARGKDFSDTPAWNWDFALNHIDMQPFLLDANGADAKLKMSGTGQLRISASTRGVDPQQLMSNLNGSTDFTIVNGKVEGIDVNYLLQAANALLHKKSIASLQSADATMFDSFKGSVLINNGVAETNNLVLSAPAFMVNAQGHYNLPQRNIDLSLQASSQQILDSKWQLPIIVRGALANPEIQLDMSAINKQIAQNELATIKDKVKTEIKNKVPGKAGEYLQNLIGN